MTPRPPRPPRPRTLLGDVAAYYSERLGEFGATPRGVDWNGAGSQALRFRELTRVIGPQRPFSVNDLGCGYGALADYLESRFPDGCRYSGCDVSPEMVREAMRLHSAGSSAGFCVGAIPPEAADYGIASGIFNVRLQHGDAAWAKHLEATLDVLNDTSRRGFAFNCLTSYSDRERMRDYLYYADPCRLFDLCKRRYSRNVALLHDYGLYEFTILVRKIP